MQLGEALSERELVPPVVLTAPASGAAQLGHMVQDHLPELVGAFHVHHVRPDHLDQVGLGQAGGQSPDTFGSCCLVF